MISGGREQVTYHQYRSLWNHVERGFCGQAGQINIRDLPVTSEPLGATCGTRRGVFCRKRIARFLDFILWTGEKKKTHGRHERGLREKRSRSGLVYGLYPAFILTSVNEDWDFSSTTRQAFRLFSIGALSVWLSRSDVISASKPDNNNHHLDPLWQSDSNSALNLSRLKKEKKKKTT